MLGIGKKSRQLVGLDIGSSSIKAVELKAGKGGYELVSFGTEMLAPDTVVDGAIMDAPMDVLLVAVKKDKILNHTNVLAQAGKTPVVVDIDAFGLQNCFEVNYEPDAGQTVALLNIGASVMNINIVRGGIPLFTRDVSVGGNQYTDALQKELDLSFEDAERLKRG